MIVLKRLFPEMEFVLGEYDIRPIGRNAFYCLSHYGLSSSWSNLNCINKHFAWHWVKQHIIHPMLDKLSILWRCYMLNSGIYSYHY